MRVLITGGAGFLGWCLAQLLYKLGHTVVVYDLPPAQGENAFAPHADEQPPVISPIIEMVQGSVTDRDALISTLAEHRIDHIVHLATLLTGSCSNDPVAGTMVNAVGTAAVFDAAWRVGIRRVVFGSSVAALGHRTGPPAGDRAFLGPTSVYGATKAYSELLAGALRTERPEQELVGLRFGWVYGWGRTRGWNVLQDMIEAFALEHDEVPYPDYDRPNDWTYIDDAVDAIVRCLDSPRPSVPAYNVPGAYHTVQEAVEYLHTIFPRANPVARPAHLPDDAWNFRLDHITQETGYRPRFGLEEGLEQTVAAIRSHNQLPPIALAKRQLIL